MTGAFSLRAWYEEFRAETAAMNPWPGPEAVVDLMQERLEALCRSWGLRWCPVLVRISCYDLRSGLLLAWYERETGRGISYSEVEALVVPPPGYVAPSPLRALLERPTRIRAPEVADG